MAKRSVVAARTGRRPEDFSFERKAFYSPAEVARILGVSDQTVLDLVHEDRLFAVQIGPRLYRIPWGSFSIASLPARARTSTIRTSSVSLSPRPRSLEASTTAVSRYVASASGGSFTGEASQRASVPRDPSVWRRGRERLLRAAASHVARRRPVRALRGGEQA